MSTIEDSFDKFYEAAFSDPVKEDASRKMLLRGVWFLAIRTFIDEMAEAQKHKPYDQMISAAVDAANEISAFFESQLVLRGMYNEQLGKQGSEG